jgi:PLD-like domain
VVDRPDVPRRASIALLADRDHYERVTLAIARAQTSVWIATANVKQLLVEAPVGTRDRARGRYVPILDTIQSLCDRGVSVRLLHATPPSGPFRDELARRAGRLPRPRFEMRACPRVHLKMIAIDGALLYLGSANFTGAGLGAKGDGRRNFEMGVLTDDDWMLDAAQARFDRIWRGIECAGCTLRRECPAPLDLVARTRRAPSNPVSPSGLGPSSRLSLRAGELEGSCQLPSTPRGSRAGESGAERAKRVEAERSAQGHPGNHVTKERSAQGHPGHINEKASPSSRAGRRT